MRPHDIAFVEAESLWRAVAKDAIDKGGKIKPNKLRLQVSVAREKFGKTIDSAINPQRPDIDGIAQISAGIAAAIRVNDVTVVCVDDPNKDNEAHALVAFVAAPGCTPTDEDLTKARALLAARMVVVRNPTK